MKKIIVFEYGFLGVLVADRIKRTEGYEFCGFADNSPHKQGKIVAGRKILDIDQLNELNRTERISIVIASNRWKEIVEQCITNNLSIEAIYIDGRLSSYPLADFTQLDLSTDIRLYAGNICREDWHHWNDPNLFALSINKHDDKHIIHDINNHYPLPDCSIASYEAECVFEYIEYDKLQDVVNEIWRILKPDGTLRICLPDYNSKYLKNRTMMDDEGVLLFDAGCGGYIDADGFKRDSSFFFPTRDVIDSILVDSRFSCIEWLCFFSDDGVIHRKKMDESRGFVQRVMGRNDEDIYCMVVDCRK